MRELASYLFLISLFWTGILTPIAIRLGRSWAVLDIPDARKIHAEPTPLVGGWAIFSTLTLVLWGHLVGALLIRNSALEIYLGDKLQFFISIAPQLIFKIAPVYLGALVIFLLGLADDVRGMSIKTRLVVQIITACTLTFLGFHPSMGFLPRWLAYCVGIIWIVGITNAFNFLDGLDGLSSGVALVSSLALLTIMGIKYQPDVVFFLSALSGTILGFLRYNYYPAKAFLGSSGSLLLGYLMAMLTMQVTYMHGETDNWLIPLLSPVFILAIPLYDTGSVILIRLIQSRSIATGDRSHFHHRLMNIGFSHRQTVTFIILVSFSVALSAVRLTNASLYQSILILAQILGILSILVIAERVAVKVRTEMLHRIREQNAQPATHESNESSSL